MILAAQLLFAGVAFHHFKDILSQLAGSSESKKDLMPVGNGVMAVLVCIQ